MLVRLNEGRNTLTFRNGDDGDSARSIVVTYHPMTLAAETRANGPTRTQTYTGVTRRESQAMADADAAEAIQHGWYSGPQGVERYAADRHLRPPRRLPHQGNMPRARRGPPLAGRTSVCRCGGRSYSGVMW